ncbi:MAG TPA: hypothetical protein PK668_16910 [Myxococcota bacterium]|nr:hypothetical protein [Myxococcota bacterium]HRY94840.1 hypothetical protein [Myxococcota bacterium]
MQASTRLQIASLALAAVLASAGPGCQGGSEPGDGGQDAEADGQGEDGRDEGSGADVPDGGDAEGLWPWCPDPSAYVGGGWDHLARVDDQALYCVLNQGATVEEDLALKARLRLVPGAYPLPREGLEAACLLPACLELPGGVGSELAGEGWLAVAVEPSGQGQHLTWQLAEPLQAGGRPWSVEISASMYTYSAAAGVPELVLSNRLTRYEAWGELYTSLRLTHAELPYPWQLLPCRPDTESHRQDRATFDRGWMEVWHDVVDDVPSGGGAPAVLARGFGELDGVAFDQRDYFKLGHLIAHHNWGGTFLVMLDTPIGQACGLKLAIPSLDGGGPDPAAWTVGCDLAPLEELTGLVTGP